MLTLTYLQINNNKTKIVTKLKYIKTKTVNTIKQQTIKFNYIIVYINNNS